MWSPTIRSDELYHEGVLGMKHGVRNGPPYPLDSDQISAAERKAGWLQKFADHRQAVKKKKKQQQALEKARKKRAANKKDADERKRIVEKGSKDEVLKNRRRLSPEEMNKALDRLKAEDVVNQRISELSNPTYQRIEKFSHYADRAKTLATGTQKFIDAYNTGAGIYNAVMEYKGIDQKLPKINYNAGGGDGGKKNNNNQNNSPNPVKMLLNAGKKKN